MLAAIRGATDNINMEMYIFSDGPIGKMFADALIERQRHGVQVNLSYDSLGSFSTSSAFLDRLRKAGIAVMQYRPVNPFAARLHWEFGHRDHRKMLVVDGRVAFTGGINISEVYASGLGGSGSRTPSTYWRDTDIEVRGPAVAEFQKLFIQQWNYQRGPLLQVRDYFPPPRTSGQPDCASDRVRAGAFQRDLCHRDFGNRQCRNQYLYHRCLFRAGSSDVACAGACCAAWR